MPTPLDQLFEKIGENPPDTLNDIARAELDEFSALLDNTIPPKRTVSSNLLIATWNIAHFASLQKRWQVPAQSSLSPKRDYRCLMIIAEIISRFDVVALQEVKGDLRAIRYLLSALGSNWAFLMTDVSKGDEGNSERMAYVYDTTRVSPSGLAGELVVPDEAHEFGFDEGSFKKQFARNPYAVSFKAKDTTFILVTAHVSFGDKETERLPEVRAIAQWMRDWASYENRFHHNLLVLGDFNLERSDSVLYKAFVESGLEVPFILSAFPRTIYGRETEAEKSSYHDQIAWFSKGNAVLKNMEMEAGGAVMLYDHLLKDLNLSKQSFAARVSDHHPLWVEFKTSHSGIV